MLAVRQTASARKQLLKKSDEPSLVDIIATAQSGDILPIDRLEALGVHLGIVAAFLANLFAPETIILAGEAINCCATVRQTIERSFRDFTLPQILRTADLEDSSLGSFAGALGGGQSEIC